MLTKIIKNKMEKTKISEFLKENNMSFTALADAINVKRTTLMYNLSNEKIPLVYLIDIAKVLQVQVSDLIYEDYDVDINGHIKFNDIYYNLNNLDDLISFTERLVEDFGMESNLYYSPKKEFESI